MKNLYAITPYTHVDGVPSFKDSEIDGWHSRLIKENTLRWVFFDGSVVDGEQLVRMVKSPGLFFFTVWTEKEENTESYEENDTEMVGFFWLSNFIGNSAFLHHVIFRKFWGAEARKIGRFVLEYIFGIAPQDGTPIVGTLLGLTPENNIHAVRFNKAIGMKNVGRIPGVFYDFYNNITVDGIMCSMTRESCIATRKE